ncbi:MAG: hypothetical protein IJA10_08005 [Lachnospiraceae bacterium]|nr:hypothetical protein [Lachnospiraceae bacterium]
MTTATVEGLAKAIAKGMITQALLNCALTKVLGKAANTVVKLIGIAQDTESFIEAVKSGDPERIMVESLRLVVSLYTLKCECFTGETLVSTTEGDKRIDEIEVGDYVYAYDTEKEEKVPAKVTYVSITETDILVHVYTSEGEEIKTTMFHPFYVKNAKNGEDETYGIWKASANLVAGDELLTDDGRIVYVEEVRIERLAESIKVYNLEVEGLYTYYVGSGVLVHNDYAQGGKNNASGSDRKSVKPEAAVTGSKKHGVNWKEGPARAKATGKPQGQWAKSDLDYATEMANTLKPGESAYFDLPEGSQSIVHMPDGTTQLETKMWIRNNGTETWHGYPMPDMEE